METMQGLLPEKAVNLELKSYYGERESEKKQ